jgi:hypothetical protein
VLVKEKSKKKVFMLYFLHYLRLSFHRLKGSLALQSKVAVIAGTVEEFGCGRKRLQGSAAFACSGLF